MDKSSARRAGVGTLGLVVAALSLSACGGDSTSTSTQSVQETTVDSTVDPTVESTMSAAEVATLEPHNDADAQFASLMITHHAQAIAMTDIVLARDDLDLAIFNLAADVKATQGAEIEHLRGWRTAWGVPETADEEMDMGGMDHSDTTMGVLSVEQMAELEEAGPRKAANLYLTYMITHHEGSIAMANTEVKDGVNPAAVALAQEMIRSQTLALVQMKTLLAP